MTGSRAQQGLFALALLLGLAIIWIGDRPPMVDLPQHAGQLRLLHDLWLGTSPWAALVEINLWTPYLIGFGLALPLSLVMPVGVALQVVLSAAYLGFVFLAVKLRQAFDAPAGLDWLLVFSFFGFAFKWGFLTFLVAAPVGLAWLWLCLRHLRATGARSAWGLFGLGLLLLLSHALVFVYALATGLLMTWLHAPDRRAALRRAVPLLALGFVCLLYTMARGHAEARYGIPPTVPAVDWHFGLRHEILFYSFGTGWNAVYAAAAAALAVGLGLSGCRPRGRLGGVAAAPLIVLLAVLLCVPSFAMETTFLYQRFALFLLPALAWVLAAPAGGPVAGWRRRTATGLMAAAAFAVLGAKVVWAQRWAEESADFRTVQQQLEPGRRALAIVLDPGTRAEPTPRFAPYRHFASWYQADQGGLVDMNFAVAPPQIVRYRPDFGQRVPLNFSWSDGGVDAARHHAGSFRYFLVRQTEGSASSAFAQMACAPERLAGVGAWTAFDNRRCQAAEAEPGARAAR